MRNVRSLTSLMTSSLGEFAKRMSALASVAMTTEASQQKLKRDA
jgi:hypothetical protein